MPRRLNMYESKAMEEAKEDIYTPQPSCFKCSHFKVCKVVATLMPAVEAMFRGDQSPPLIGNDLEILAWKCTAYERKIEETIPQ